MKNLYLNASTCLWRTALWLGLVLLSFFWLVNSANDTSEAGADYKVAWRIVNHGELGFPGKEVLGIDNPADSLFTVAPTGRCYAVHEVGNAFALVPLAWLVKVTLPTLVKFFPRLVAVPASAIPNGKTPVSAEDQVGRVLRTYQAGLIWAVNMTLFFLILTQFMEVSPSMAKASTLLVASSTYVVFYSHFLFDGDLVALCFLVCLYYHLRHLESFRARDQAYSMLAGGMMVITRLTSVLLLFSILVWCAYVWYQNRRRIAVVRHLILSGFVLLPFATWQLWYNHLRTGQYLVSPVTGGQYLQNQLDGNIVDGITGYLFSPGMSLFVYAPLLLVACTGVGALRIRKPVLAFHWGVVFVAWLSVHSRLHFWYGGSSLWGPRYFISILPLLMLPLALVLPRLWATRAGKVTVLVLTSWGILFQLASTIINERYRILYASEQGWFHAERLDNAFWWDPVRNSASDTMLAAYHNVMVMLGRGSLQSPKYADPIGIWASNTWNNWAVRFHLMRVPDALTILVFLGLLGTICLGLYKTRSCEARPEGATILERPRKKGGVSEMLRLNEER